MKKIFLTAVLGLSGLLGYSQDCTNPNLYFFVSIGADIPPGVCTCVFTFREDGSTAVAEDVPLCCCMIFIDGSEYPCGQGVLNKYVISGPGINQTIELPSNEEFCFRLPDSWSGGYLTITRTSTGVDPCAGYCIRQIFVPALSTCAPPPPVANFDIVPNGPYGSCKYLFQNTSTPATGVTYMWSVHCQSGNCLNWPGAAYTSKDVYFNAPCPGVYSVGLTVKNNLGCSSTIYKSFQANCSWLCSISKGDEEFSGPGSGSTIFPNPVRGKMEIFLEIAGEHYEKPAQFLLYDMTGRLAHSENTVLAPRLEIQLPDRIRNGMYIAVLRSDSEIYVQDKIVVED